MLSLTISQKSGQRLADQIVAGIKRQIDDRYLRPGVKLPSIRNFADTHKVSRFTVVEAYDRLVAMGHLHPRRGAGFFTAAAPLPATHPAPSDRHQRNEPLVVEDDIFCDLQVKQTPRLATLDQLQRVIYVRSFSKTLSGSLRVGFVASTQAIAHEFADIKMLTSITTSLFTERLVYLMLVDGHYRKYLSRLQQRLGEARVVVVRAFERIGLELFAEPLDGVFLWARFPQVEDSLALAEAAQREGLVLAPGAVFRPRLERSPWLRFNVAVCADPRVLGRLERLAKAERP